MASIDPLLERNKHFATTTAREGVSIIAKHPVYVITCLDPRTDPSAFLELGLGDAMVIRNAGGRGSPDVLTDLAYIGYLSKRVVPGGPRFEVAVIHHNDCGTHFLANADFRRGFADLIGGDDAGLAAQAVVHPRADRPPGCRAAALQHRPAACHHRLGPRLRRGYRPGHHRHPGRSYAHQHIRRPHREDHVSTPLKPAPEGS